MTANGIEILLVEDNPRDVEMTVRALKKRDLANNIHVAKNGADALDFLFATGAYVDRRPPDLIILDIHMPGMDGIEVLRRLKAQPETSDIPVILMSAIAEVPEWVQGLELGALDYIAKPFAHAELLARVHVRLEFHRLQKAERAAQETLAASELRYRSLFDTSRDAIMTLEPPSWRFTTCNPAAVAVFGTRDTEHFAMLGPGELSPAQQPDGRSSGEKAREMIETALREGSHSFEWTHRRFNGKSFPATVLLSRLETDGKAFLQATVRDITDRKQAEDKLREKERLLSESQRLGHVGSWFYDMKGPMNWSEELYRLYGVSPGTFIPTGESLLSLIHPDDRPAMQAWLTTCAAGAKHELVFRIIRPDGALRFILGRGESFHDAENRLIHMAGTAQDITEQKRQEAEHQELEKQLQEKQKLAAVGTLACGMGHEINNPITGIINYAQLIKDRLHGKNEALEEFAGEIVIEAERIAGIVRGLSAFATRNIATRVAVPVSDLVESALSATRATLSHDHITLAIDVPADLPAIPCDRPQIVEVLTGLLSNARDALNERYPGHDQNKKVVISATGMTMSLVNGDLSLARENEPNNQSPITDNADRRIRAVRFTVEDHGTGIPAAVREHIFEPFFTTKDTSVGAGSIGKGLGLFVSYATVQEHGGALSVESEVGHWTRVHVDLPAGESVISER